ncbi:alpha/beta fold hydrolase [Corynebacterium phoceense]|uniref:alpha/beta fold hydrolase n=1 Tax=Corynebacterium phoceense TaxID=1686286 RepID=UPI00211C792C|nr:alpha/beta fold hydrolase [Corynebacterium phoceense]MCQ9347820.1 alpha/beta fold hydrolase [Corynebacterium phoceense]
MILNARETGLGTPLVLLGSIASTTHMWDPQIPQLAKNHRVIALDHPGHGDSPDPTAGPGETTVEDLANNVLETLDSLGVEEFGVIGLSLGGALAQYLAATSPRVTRAAFLCTAPYLGGPDKWAPRSELTRAHGMDPMLEGVFGLWVTPEFAQTHPGYSAELRQMITSTRGVGYAACADALAGWDFRDRLEEISVPVLTLAGADDQSTPPETVHGIGTATGGEHQQLTVPGAHVPTVESPKLVTDALVERFS